MNETTVEVAAGRSAVQPPVLPEEPKSDATVSAAEREWLRGPLSKETSYRLIVDGALARRKSGS